MDDWIVKEPDGYLGYTQSTALNHSMICLVFY